MTAVVETSADLVTEPLRTVGPASWPTSFGPGPRWATPRSPERPSFGPSVAKAAELLGGALSPMQRYIADVALEVDPESGELVYDEVIVLAQRRAGKTYLERPLVAWRCGQPEPGHVWMTAQKRAKAVARWLEVSNALLNSPLRGQLRRKVSITNEVLTWRGTGSSFQPFLGSAEDEMHGEDPDMVFVDELWSFDLGQKRRIEQGYKPAWSVKPGQAWLLSAAGTPRSEWLNEARRRGRRSVEEDQRRRVAFFEWGVPEMVDGTPVGQLPDDQLLQLVVDCHPRRDHGLRPAFLADELESMQRPDFLRAYGNVSQSDEDEQGVFTGPQMERAKSGARIPDDARIALGIGVDPDRRDASIGICVRDALGVAVTDERRAEGVRWLAGTVIRLVDQYDVGTVAVVAAGPGRRVADELARAGVPLLRLSQADHAAACAGFSDEFTEGGRPSVTWNGSSDFAKAVVAASAARRPSGIVWESRTGESISALDARTLAVWAHDHMPEPAPVVEPRVW